MMVKLLIWKACKLMTPARFIFLFGASLIALTAGCGESIPEVTQGRGTVTINGKPLPNAVVKFVPLHERLNGTHVAVGETDENGKFELVMNSVPGVFSGQNKVIIQEGEAPAAARAMTAESTEAWNEFKRSLVNRPIPSAYMSVALTPLEFDVSSEKTEYEIDLKR